MRSIIVFAAALFLTGCTTTHERLIANKHIEKEPQIYNEMVLENLVNISQSTATLPYFATLDTGIPQVADMGSFGGFFTFTPQTIVKQLHNQHGGQVGPISGSRSIQSNWTVKPVNDDNRLKAMRYLYMWTLNCPIRDMTDFNTSLAKYFPTDPNTGQLVTNFSQGWFRCGSWHEKPKDAEYYIYRHATAYWVDPRYEEEFAKLTLAMLRIALQAPQTTTVNTYEYNNGRLTLQKTFVRGFKAETDAEISNKAVLAAREAIKLAAEDTARDILVSFAQTSAEDDEREFFRTTDLPSQIGKVVGKEFGPLTTVKEIEDKLNSNKMIHSIVECFPAAVKASSILDEPSKNKTFSDMNTSSPLVNNIVVHMRSAKNEAVQKTADQNVNLPDPELKIDTFSNPEISPGLITLPH